MTTMDLLTIPMGNQDATVVAVRKSREESEAKARRQMRQMQLSYLLMGAKSRKAKPQS